MEGEDQFHFKQLSLESGREEKGVYNSIISRDVVGNRSHFPPRPRTSMQNNNLKGKISVGSKFYHNDTD